MRWILLRGGARNAMDTTIIHESRRLLLPFDTVVDALIELETKHGRWPAQAELVGVVLRDGGPQGERSIVMSVRASRHEEPAQRTYALPLIAAAIVNYCMKLRVPMPRSSTKTIDILPDGIALQLDNTLKLPRQHAEGPQVSIEAVPAGESAAADGAAAPAGVDAASSEAQSGEGADAAQSPEPTAGTEAPLA